MGSAFLAQDQSGCFQNHRPRWTGSEQGVRPEGLARGPLHSAPWTGPRQPCRSLRFGWQNGCAPTPGSLSCPPGHLLPEGLQGEWPEAQHCTGVHSTGPASHLVPAGGGLCRGALGCCCGPGVRVVEKRGGPPGGRRGLTTPDWQLARWVWWLQSRQVRGRGRHSDHKAARAAIQGRGAGGSAERSAASTCVLKMEPTGSADGGAGGGRGGEQREDSQFLA